MCPQHMLSWGNKENINRIWLKKVSYLDLCLEIAYCIATDKRGYPYNIFLIS